MPVQQLLRFYGSQCGSSWLHHSADCSEPILPSSVGYPVYGRYAVPVRPACPRSPACIVEHLFSCKRSEEHTSELQSRGHLVCRLLLENNKQRCLRAQSTDGPVHLRVLVHALS